MMATCAHCGEDMAALCHDCGKAVCEECMTVVYEDGGAVKAFCDSDFDSCGLGDAP